VKTLAGTTELAFDDVGTGTPVLFLHGFPLDRTMWAPQLGALVTQARCIAMDLRGFGESSVRGPFTMDQYADDALEVLDALHVERAVIAGLSMGGYVALNLWRRQPERVRGLVLANTRAAADTEEGRERRRQLIAMAREKGSAAVATKQLEGLIGKTTRQRHPDIVELAHMIMMRPQVDGVIGALEAMMSRPDSTSLLETIDVPTMLVAGEEDAVIHPREMRAMHEAIRGSRFEVIIQAGHLSNLERPAAFNTLLSEFLAGLIYH
jgi:3-oxoadipate enol-lactonase